MTAATAALSALVLSAYGTYQNAQAQQVVTAVPDAGSTATPIKHLVVIFDENVSFDHYFATYPHARNTGGTTFVAASDTPRVNNLRTAHLLHDNPNLYDPRRLTPSEAITCDQNHSYLPEQKAADGGANDMYVQNTSVDSCTGMYGAPGLTMDYYDGNTVTAMWNYAQHFALSDNTYETTFGPSTPGAINLISGQTHGIIAVNPDTLKKTSDSYVTADPDAEGVGTVINDPDPAFDDCSNKNHTSSNNLGVMRGKNIGDLLNQNGVTWGWFQGGFTPTVKATSSTPAVCGRTHANIAGAVDTDYSPHHSPFQYYKSTSNPHHLPPTSLANVGHTDRANHQYGLGVFNRALTAGYLPAVSFLKASEYQDGHAGYSDPIDEQHFLVREINAIQRSKFWASTAIVITYDDSDGWYDHQSSPLLTGSDSTTNDASACAAAPITYGGYLDRCGPGPRLPLLVISPYTTSDHVDHKMLEQTSVLHFIEMNWGTGRISTSSFDGRARPLSGMFDFANPDFRRVILRPNGSVKSMTQF